MDSEPHAIADEMSTVATAAAVPHALAKKKRAPQFDVTSAEEALHVREVESTRRFIQMGLLLAISVSAAVPFAEFHPASARVLLAGYVIGLASLARAWLVLRQPERFVEIDAALLAIGSGIAGSCGVYYFGYFSPAPLATSMALFFFGLSQYRRVAWFIYTSTALVHGGVMIAMLRGIIPDHGIVAADDVSLANQLVLIGLVQSVFFLTFFMARGVSSSMVSSTVRLVAAVREVAQRDALLEEARRELEHALEVGGPGRFTEQVLGSYRLGLLCGRGAMGDVYEATHLETGEAAAVKLLHREGLSDPDNMHRFLRESRIASSVQVPNVVKVLEVASEDSPVPYIAMELLHGADLAQLLRERRRLSADEVVQLVREVGRGVDAAHRAGVIHRDIKPRNLFRSDAGGHHTWKVLDFGVSRLVREGLSLTRGQAVGTPSYMSPEQARGRDVSPQSDIFALGVIAYRSLTGRPAFVGSEVPEILFNVVHSTPPRPSSVVDVPVAVDFVLALAMAKPQSARFESAAEFTKALDAALLGSIGAGMKRRAEKVLRRFPWDSMDGENSPR